MPLVLPGMELVPGPWLASSGEEAGLWAQVTGLASVRALPGQCWRPGRGLLVHEGGLQPLSLLWPQFALRAVSAEQADLECKQALHCHNSFITSSQVPRGTQVLQLMGKLEREGFGTALEHHKV